MQSNDGWGSPIDNQTAGRRQVTGAVLALLGFAGALLVANSAGARADRSTLRPDPLVFAAGDIARCETKNDERTAAIVRAEPRAMVLTLGDHVYPAGTKRAYERCYGPSWGRFKRRTKPTPGNHDVKLEGTEGGRHYRRYFRAPDYYAFDLGSWRVYSLNSELESLSEQVAWLEADLEANPRACVLAYWHRPLFSSGRHGGFEGVKPFWDVLYAHRADIVLGGNDHSYERFGRQTPDGRQTRAGIRQFVVGTGGTRLRPIDPGRRGPTSRVTSDSAHGVLRLVFRPDSYEWQFVPAEGDEVVNRWTGRRVVEAGKSRCVQ